MYESNAGFDLVFTVYVKKEWKMKGSYDFLLLLLLFGFDTNICDYRKNSCFCLFWEMSSLMYYINGQRCHPLMD